MGLFACTSGVKVTTGGTLGTECDADSQCASGLCRGEGQRYCSALCSADAQCASPDAGYCCELLGGQGICQRTTNGECRGAKLGTSCGGTNDPLCLRVGLECARTGDVFSCTKTCTSAEDCAGLVGAGCERVGDRNLCVPPDLSSLPRRQSDCVGDASCSGDDICQVYRDSDVDPRTVVTQCSSLRYGNLPVGTACDAAEQCDRGFCVEGFCSAPCASDAWCPADSYCRSLSVVARADDPDTTVNERILGSLRMCRKRTGSELTCDSECLEPGCTTAPCPVGESCRRRVNYDGTSALACQTFPEEEAQLFDTGLAAGSRCSPTLGRNLDGTRIRDPIDGRVQICASESCFAPGYCGAPCRTKSDCPATDYSGAAMTCVYLPFQQTCARVDFNPGKANGEECSGSSLIVADNMCASLYCNSSTSRCSARKPSGSSCARADECEALVCVAGKCLQPCRSTEECAEGACLATAFRIDSLGTPNNPNDDRFDLPTFCANPAGSEVVSEGPPRELRSCSKDNDCPGKVCRVVFDNSGAAKGICANSVVNGLVTGQACTGNNQCNSQLCASGRCTLPCRSSGDCPAEMACGATSVFGQAAVNVCLLRGTGTAGAACTENAGCESRLCVDGTCVAPCSSIATPYTAEVANEVVTSRCVPLAISVDPRLTPQTFDDRVDYVLGALQTRLCEREADCSGGASCVFRPWDDVDGRATLRSALRGHCESSPGLLEGERCHYGASCGSGLCVQGECAKPCVDAADCADAQECALRPAGVLEQRSVTRSVKVCATPCVNCSSPTAER